MTLTPFLEKIRTQQFRIPKEPQMRRGKVSPEAAVWESGLTRGGD
jgi:hypothetical protein